MGEIAEMMLDGTLCSCCGVLLIGEGDEEVGFPMMCRSCSDDEGETVAVPGNGRPVGCPDCKRRFKTHNAYLDHYRAKHDRKKP